MDDQKRPSITDPIENLVSRVKALEDQDHGWIAKAGRYGVIIGCVGGLIGGVSTLRVLWIQVTAKPNFEVVTDRNLTLSWNAGDRSLSFTRNILFENTGEVVGHIAEPPQISLESKSLASAEVLSDIQAEDEHDVVRFPWPVKASDARTLTFIMTSKFSPDSEPAFPKEGTYRLSFSLRLNASPTVPDVYCFQLTPLLIAQLQETGAAKFVASDPNACSP